MKLKQLSIVALLSIAFVACKSKDSFEIDGKLTNIGTEKKVYLYGIQNNNMVLIDSTTLSENGEFKFIRKTPTVDFFRVSIGKNEYMLIAKDGDLVKLEADLLDKSFAYKISGAEEADKLTELNNLKNDFSKKMAVIQQQFEDKVAANPTQRENILEELRPTYEGYMKDFNSKLLDFSNKNESSLTGFYAISMLNPADYEKELIAYAHKVKDKIKGNTAIDAFVKQMEGLKAVSVGAQAPDFTVNSIDGKPIKLADFKGKYVLLDFWASWCQPCRQENPNVVKAYNQFKDKNFTILGISLDTDKAAWQKAIQADGLNWNHGSELKDFNGEIVKKYHVDAIPASFLVDPQGKIVAKNLRGEALSSFLNKTLH